MKVSRPGKSMTTPNVFTPDNPRAFDVGAQEGFGSRIPSRDLMKSGGRTRVLKKDLINMEPQQAPSKRGGRGGWGVVLRPHVQIMSEDVEAWQECDEAKCVWHQ